MREVASEADLKRVLSEASSEARELGKLNLVQLHAPNGNEVSLVVGGDETVVGFRYGSGDPPYLASRGDSTDDEPLLTAYVALSHHTEFSRKWVVPSHLGEAAAVEFLRTGDLPRSISWVEV